MYGPDTAAVYASAQTNQVSRCSNDAVGEPEEIHMYIGGGILGTILVIVLILWLVRRI
jgi:hypothetical protein